MTQSLEDYLETIFILCGEKKFTRIKEISDRMSVSKPSVIQAIKELKQTNLIIQEPYGYIELTNDGIKKAKEIFKKHNVLKKFLKDILGVSDEVAEKDACRIEHIISDETFNRIFNFMRGYNGEKVR